MGSAAGVEERVRDAVVRGLAWAVSEPNDEALWTRARDVVSNLLTGYWRDGELAGRKPEEAFFVRCGRDTMTQQDLDDGRLVVVIGLATIAPAEFVVLTIEQTVGGRRRRWFPWRRLARAGRFTVRPQATPRSTTSSEWSRGGSNP